jgi:hypothetical protein
VGCSSGTGSLISQDVAPKSKSTPCLSSILYLFIYTMTAARQHREPYVGDKLGS